MREGILINSQKKWKLIQPLEKVNLVIISKVEDKHSHFQVYNLALAYAHKEHMRRVITAMKTTRGMDT